MLTYSLSIPRPSSHLFEIGISLETLGAATIDIEFPAWSPGRYFIYDFARNVQELRAFGDDDVRLDVEKIAKGTWRVHTAGHRSARIDYRMFGDTLSGTFSQLDDRHASVNGSSVFGYVVGRQSEPIELEINAPDGWKAYTSMASRRRRGRAVLQAENYDVLIDSPIEIGTPIVRKFTLNDIAYHIVMDIAGAEWARTNREVRERIDRFVADTEKTVRAYADSFGRPEFTDYYFLVNLDPSNPHGDGMEHLASTRLVINGHITDDDAYESLVGVMCHEFFHIWNVKRMRPAELGPFDYTRELYTTLLWVAEGFTQYYGHLMLARAGVWDEKRLYKHLVSEINTVDRSPGRFHRNLRQSSFDTWHAVSARNPMGGVSNFKNTYVNYYPKGAVVAFMLDLELRRLTDNRRSLDDVVRELYRKTYAEAEPGDYYLRGVGYTEKDVYDAITTVAGRSMRSFLRRAVENAEELDYAKHLKHVGLELVRGAARDTDDAAHRRRQLYTGVVIADNRHRTKDFVAIANVIEGSPADLAGLSAGDLVLAIDGERIDGASWDAVMAMKRPGEEVEFTVFRGPRLMSVVVPTEERDTRSMKLRSIPTPDARQRKARRLWLGQGR